MPTEEERERSARVCCVAHTRLAVHLLVECENHAVRRESCFGWVCASAEVRETVFACDFSRWHDCCVCVQAIVQARLKKQRKAARKKACNVRCRTCWIHRASPRNRVACV